MAHSQNIDLDALFTHNKPGHVQLGCSSRQDEIWIQVASYLLIIVLRVLADAVTFNRVSQVTRLQ